MGTWNSSVPYVPEVERARRAELKTALAADHSVLHDWAADAYMTADDLITSSRSMTRAEQVAVLNRLGKLCDKLADLLEVLRFD